MKVGRLSFLPLLPVDLLLLQVVEVSPVETGRLRCIGRSGGDRCRRMLGAWHVLGLLLSLLLDSEGEPGLGRLPLLLASSFSVCPVRDWTVETDVSLSDCPTVSGLAELAVEED